MPFLATILERVTGLKVADETGLSGGYDIKLEFAPEPGSAPEIGQDSPLPSLFTALRETLGLELKARQIPVQFLVIDHIDRVPVAN